MTTRRHLHDVTPLQVAGEPDAPRAVIVLQEAFGVSDHIRDVAERFALAGFYAVAPELFHRTGSPEIAYDNFPGAMESLGALSEDGLREDVTAAAGFLVDAGYAPSNTGVVGFCVGGSVAFFAGTLGVVGAAVSFYGGGIETGRMGLPSLLDQAALLQCAWCGFYGDLDQGIPIEQVEALRVATSTLGFSNQLVRYADADHGFHCDGRPGVFNARAAAEAYERTLAFFAANLAPR